MPDRKTLNARDAKLVQWLGEAYAKEAELEADLTAHIALTEKQSYKKRLRKHLTETRDHKRRVAARIKKLGGTPVAGPAPAGVPTAINEAAGKAVAAVKGQVGTARAVITPQAETHLRNAQEELREEHVEIAIYTRIETLAVAVADRDTAQLAKSIRRDEERMAKFLDAELVRLVKEVVRTEIPRDERAAPKRRSTRRRTTAARTRAASRTSTGVVRSTAGSASGGTTRSRSAASRTKSTGSRSTASRNGTASSKRSTARTQATSRA
jgi:ferritin-like metal-binding protein YciE